MELLNKLLEKLGKKEQVPDVLKELPTQPPTPFYVSHVPDMQAMAQSNEPRAYFMDRSTERKLSPSFYVEMKGRYGDNPPNVGVGPYPTRRSQNKGDRVYRTKPGTVTLTRGD